MFDPLAHGAVLIEEEEFDPLAHGATLVEGEVLEGDDSNWGELIGKSLLSGALSFADLPVVLAGLGEMGIDFARGNEIKSPKSFEHLPSNYLKKGIESITGWNPQPQPKTGKQRVASAILEGGAGVLTGAGLATSLAKAGAKEGTKKAAKFLLGADGDLAGLTKGAVAKNIAKSSGLGAAVGGTTQGLQEGGVDPITAALISGGGISAAGGLTRKGTNILRSLTPKNRVSKKLQEAVGKENIPEILEKLKQEGLLGTEAMTADLAENRGISSLFKQLKDRSPDILEREAANIKRVEEGAQGLYKDLGQIRTATDKPLFDAVVNTDTLHELPSFEKLLASRSRNTNKTTQDLIKSMRKEFAGKLKDPKKVNITEELGKAISDTNVDTASFQHIHAPLGLIENVRRTFHTQSQKGTDKTLSRFYGEAANALKKDLARHELGLKHLQNHANKSAPLNFLENHPLSKKAIKEVPEVEDLFSFDPEATKNPYMNKAAQELESIFGAKKNQVRDLDTVLKRRQARDAATPKMSKTITDPSFIDNAADMTGSVLKGASKVPYIGSPIKYAGLALDKVGGMYDRNLEQALLNPSYASELLQYAPPKTQWANVASIGQGLKSGISEEERRKRLPTIHVRNTGGR